MSQLDDRATNLSYQSLMQPIESDLAQVESILREELQSDVDAVSKMLAHPMFWSGKRLRPALLLLSGKATTVGELHHHHHLLAAVLEMIHTATLVHDDVLDDADIRRHCKTINRNWGTHLSVLLGDFLFSHSFYLASTTHSTLACQKIGQATNAVCAGEIFQVNSQGNLDLSEADYFRIIEGKTAELCACACLLGAHCSGADESVVTAFQTVGRNYGRAFQIIDDLLDLKGFEETVGKSLGTDLKQLKLTLPLISALRSADDDVRNRWKTKLAAQDFDPSELLQFVDEQQGFEYAMNRAKQEVAEAQQLLIGSVGESARAVIQLGDFILERNL